MAAVALSYGLRLARTGAEVEGDVETVGLLTEATDEVARRGGSYAIVSAPRHDEYLLVEVGTTARSAPPR
jgi:hypothetical protein